MAQKLPIRACVPPGLKGRKAYILSDKCRCKDCGVHNPKYQKVEEKPQDELKEDEKIVEPTWEPKVCCCVGNCCRNIVKKENSDTLLLDTDSDDDRCPYNVVTRDEYNRWIRSLEKAKGFSCHWPKSCPASCFNHPTSLKGIKPFDRSYQPPVKIIEKDPRARKAVKRECRETFSP